MNNPAPQSDLDAAVAYVVWFRPGGPWVLTAISNDRLKVITKTFTADQVDDMRGWIEARNIVDGLNVYYHVNPTTRKLIKKADLEDIAALEWLHVDIDPMPGKPINEERDRILAMLNECRGLPKPTAIVFSGGGYQAFWRLKEPVPVNGSREKGEDLKLYNLQIELMLGADACHNVDRIMRLPGTVNWPNEKKMAKGQVPACAYVLEQHDDRVYPLSVFTRATRVQDSVPDDGGGTEATRVKVSGNVTRNVNLDDLPKELDPRAKVIITHGYDEEQPLRGADQSRSAWLLHCVGSLVRAKVDDDTIYSIITDPDYKISASVLDKGNSAQVHRYAVRQIKRAKEEVIQPELAEFNDKYAVIESMGGRCRIAKETTDPATGRHMVEFQLVDGFKLVHGNRFVMVDAGKDANGNPKLRAVPVGKWWLEHPERRTFESVTFYPNRDYPRALNLWRGFAYDAIPGECSLFLEHLRKVLCKGNEAHYRYLLGWMAYGVQNPHLPGQVALVMRGKQGTGKGTFARHYGKLFGTHYKHVVNPEHITGKFNTVLHDAVVVFADECFTKDKAHVSALKALITEETIRVEAKGVDNLESKNCLRLILATNEDWAVYVGLDDRRFFVLDVPDSHRKDTAYFGAMERQMENGGYQALLHFLLTMDLSGFDVRAVPATDELRRQQEQSMGAAESFWYQILREGRLAPQEDRWTGQVITEEFASRFVEGYAKAMTPHQAKTRLGIILRRLAPGFTNRRLRGQTVEWETAAGRKVRQASPAVWEFGGLEPCRDAWDKEFGAVAWPPIEPEGAGPEDAGQPF